MFADSFHAADILYRLNPDAFQTLATFPVSYRYRTAEKAYFDTKPTIELEMYNDAVSELLHPRHSHNNQNHSPRHIPPVYECP